MNKFRLSLIAVLVLVVGASFGAKTASAQVDIIRGRVLGSDTTPVQGVTVTATTLSGDNVRSARTDKNGRYTISFPGGEGDYWVSFAAIGFTPRRYEVKRTADQEILIADARMSASAVNLAAFQVTERVAASKSDTVTDVSGTEKTLTADNALLTAEQMGDLSAMAASIPGVQLLPGADGAADAFSVFGLGGDQNNTQLNGLSFGDSNVPRDAQVSASLVTSPYDVARGGFSGGQLQIRTRAGSNNITRRLSSTLNSPSLQWADQIGQSIANQATQLSLGGSASGPIKQD
ncbi:MAG: TonB-dependent receptor, partial [Gemmatimonadaceae bacterium]